MYACYVTINTNTGKRLDSRTLSKEQAKLLNEVYAERRVARKVIKVVIPTKEETA